MNNEKPESKLLNQVICDKCGCSGIHACIGKKVEWTPEKIKELYRVLAQYEM